MTKKLYYNLLIPTSHLASASLVGAKVHIAMRIRSNFKVLLDLHKELQDLEEECAKSGLSKEEFLAEKKEWENESYASAAHIHIFTEEQFYELNNELVSGQPIDVYVDQLLKAQGELKIEG